jgi:hypothetical protein
MDKLIAMQIGAVSFLDEGTEQVLDTLQKLGGVNTLFLANFTYTRGTGGRPFPGFPLPDHGIQEYDLNYVGGNFGMAHNEYYRRTFIQPNDFRAKDHGDLDIMKEVIPAAKSRGMKVYAWIEESAGKKGAIAQSSHIPNFAHVLETDARGRKARRPCFNHPEYLSWHLGLVEDYIKSYNLDGVIWGAERQGPFGNLLGGRWATGEITCFCEHCRSRGKERGINIQRTVEGFLEFEQFILKARKAVRPVDGYFVTFWRLLMKYPELLAWEALWHDGQKQFYREMYGLVKAINPDIQVGWHVYHLNSFSPFHRATQDLEEMSHYSDFIKLVVYNSCAGPRFVDFTKALHSTIFRDAPLEKGIELLSRFLNIEEGNLTELESGKTWSPAYIRNETKRAIASVRKSGNKTLILPGIDIDIPSDDGQIKTKPEDITGAVSAAFEAGAHGIVLSRKYSEMRLKNLEACGQAVQEYQKKNLLAK